jgi:hypothetical protein
LIIEAFKQRLFQPSGLIHVPQLISIAASHVATNYSVPDATSLGQLALNWKDVKIFQTALTTGNYLEEATGPEGTYTLVPSSPSHSWTEIRAFANRFWQDPAGGVAMAQTQIIVENDTGVPGAATRAATVLEALGYRVGTPTSGVTRQQSGLIDRSSSHAGPTLAHEIASDLHLREIDVTTGTIGDIDEVVLQLGSNDESAGDLTMPADRSAPRSVVGIEKFGIWAPDVGPPVPVPTTGPVTGTTPLDLRRRTATPERTGIAGLTPLPSPSQSPTTGTPAPSPSPHRFPTTVPPTRTPTPRPLANAFR